MSMFGFMRKTTTEPVSPPPAASSGFSFMSSSTGVSDGAVTKSSNSTEDQLFGGMSVNSPPESNASSGFSFLGGSSTVADGDSVSYSTPQPSSSFSFLSENVSPSVPPIASDEKQEPTDLMSMEFAAPQQDLKLAKAAEARNVKKKKRMSSRVGFGRDEGADGDESVQETSHTPPRSQQNYSYGNEETTNDKVSTPAMPTHLEDPIEEAEPPLVTSAPPQYLPELPHQEQVASNIAVDDSADLDTVDEVVPASTGFSFLNSAISSEITPSVEEPTHVYVPEPLSLESFSFLQPSTASSAPATSVVTTIAPEPVNVVAENKINITSSSQEPDFAIPQTVWSEVSSKDSQLESTINAFAAQFQQAYHTYLNLLSEIEKISESTNEIQDKVSQLEAKQANYAAQEDFEQAEVVSAEIEELLVEVGRRKSKKEQTFLQLRQIKDEYEGKRNIVARQLNIDVQQLDIACSSANVSMSDAKRRLDDFKADELSRMSVEEQRISMERAHCDREQEALDNETAVIEDAIKTQVGDFYDKKQELEYSVSIVQDEIKRLEALLASKREEEAELSKTLKQIDGKIVEVRKKYDRQLQRIGERKEALHNAQAECSSEEYVINRSKEQLDSIVAKASNSYEELSGTLSGKATEIETTGVLIEDLSQTVIEGTSFSLDFAWYSIPSDTLFSYFVNESASASSGDLRDRLSKLESNIRLSQSALEEKKIHLEMFVSKQKSLTETMERAELAKKVHAANKRFKEAAASAKEMTEAKEARDAQETNIQGTKEDIDSSESSYAAMLEELASVKSLLKEEEKIEKLRHYKVVKSRVNEIRRRQRSLKASQSPYDSVSSLIEALYKAEWDKLSLVYQALLQQCDIVEEPETVEEDAFEESSLLASDLDLPAESSPIEASNAQEAMKDSLDNDLISAHDDLLVVTSAVDAMEIIQEIEIEGEQVENSQTLLSPPKPSREEISAQIAVLEEEMEIAATAENYELAAELQEKIDALNDTLAKL